ncbi:hypothetical protein ALQ18_200068 [Pseudomonas marginalis pv. marginalis]|nr:hypothetical protein ALQ18_200068 [Pseudomonas marginalis pv. marginalis]
MAEHRGFSLNAANAPTENAQAVNHGGVRIGADQGVRVGDVPAAFVSVPHRLAKIFQVNLVTDAGAWRHHTEAVEGFLPPTQESVALVIALHFDTHVFFKRIVVTELIHGDRVVNHQVNRRQRVNLVNIATQPLHRFAHGGQIHHRRHAGKVLHQDARRAVGNFAIGMTGLQPIDDGFQIINLHGVAIHMTQQVFQQHFH